MNIFVLYVPTPYALYGFKVNLFLSSSVVVVTFNEGSYTVEEIAGQVSVSLRVDGKFFYPVWAIVEISDGTATGGLLYKCKGYKHL